jgi:hypothetical protein
VAGSSVQQPHVLIYQGAPGLCGESCVRWRYQRERAWWRRLQFSQCPVAEAVLAELVDSSVGQRNPAARTSRVLVTAWPSGTEQ